MVVDGFMPRMLQRSSTSVLNDCDRACRLHSRPMASLAPPSPRHPAGLIPSGELWLPRASLTACLRAAMARSTVGYTLSDAQRINRFPASPLCSLSWWFEGRSEALVAEHPDTMPTEHKLPSVMWSQEYQNEYLDMNHNVFDSYDFVQGELVWNFADFQTTEGILRVNGNKKGIFTRQRQPKDAAFLFRARWTSLPLDYKGNQ